MVDADEEHLGLLPRSGGRDDDAVRTDRDQSNSDDDSASSRAYQQCTRGAMLAVVTVFGLIAYVVNSRVGFTSRESTSFETPSPLSTSLVAYDATQEPCTSTIEPQRASPSTVDEQIHPQHPFSMALACAGQAPRGMNSFTKRFAACGFNLGAHLLMGLGDLVSEANPSLALEERSFHLARPLYSVSTARALTSLVQAAQCGPADFIQAWTCPVCSEAGFHLNNATHRFVYDEELGHENATFILVSRIVGTLPHLVAARMADPLYHSGEDCWKPCGEQAGYCFWCGVGNACCGHGAAFDPIECKGANKKTTYHTCVVANADHIAAPIVNRGVSCYDVCGKTVGLCDFCGAGNACCKRGAGGAPECRGASGFLTDGYECVTPVQDLSLLPPSHEEIGCVVAVRGTMNPQNEQIESDFKLERLPWSLCEGCKVHRGFHSVWRGVHMRVVRTLVSLGCVPGSRHSRILLTGMSFGAGVSTIAQYYLQGTGYTMEIQYNWGAPRVGNEVWAENFNGWFDRGVPIFRLTHAYDIVSRLPPRSFFGFTHVNSEVFYPAEDPEEYVVCLTGEEYECQNRWDLGQCLNREINLYDREAPSLKGNAEAFNLDHCHSGLAVDGEMCQCVISPWWKMYKDGKFGGIAGLGTLEHRFDSAPDNSGNARLAPGAYIG